MDDLQDIAQPLPDQAAFDYFAGGSDRETTLRDGTEA
jgi:hypothetical protein